MSAPRVPVTSSRASLVGGIVVGIAGMVLWVAVTHELGWSGPAAWGAGALVSAAMGIWTRVADL